MNNQRKLRLLEIILGLAQMALPYSEPYGAFDQIVAIVAKEIARYQQEKLADDRPN